jgi:hypothetical protein
MSTKKQPISGKENVAAKKAASRTATAKSVAKKNQARAKHPLVVSQDVFEAPARAGWAITMFC